MEHTISAALDDEGRIVSRDLAAVETERARLRQARAKVKELTDLQAEIEQLQKQRDSSTRS